ncbi:MAG TPA: hypothetical protein VMF12_09980 [Xanthobacteraceae bacterium]|nr:hypothetical protein [Xanthobacteraceae bacterium]
MLDASKYAEHFPDESQRSEAPDATSTSRLVAPSPALLAALSQLEREFREILRAQQPEHSERSE